MSALPLEVVYEKLEEIVGPSRVTREEFVKYAYANECGPSDFLSPEFKERCTLPDIIVRPRSTEEVSRIVKLANMAKIPVIPRGGGEGGGGGTYPSLGGIIVDMLDMNKILEIDEDSMAVRVQAGVTWGELRHELHKRGLTTGFLGPHGAWGSVVAGSICVDSPGIGSGKYGQCVENLLTLQVVLPTGDVIETGSRVNTKSKFYGRYCNGPDLTGLFTGSFGLLGIITEASLRIYPKPEYEACMGLAFRNVNDACRALYEIARMEYADDWVIYLDAHSVQVGCPEAPDDTESVFSVFATAYSEKELEVKTEYWEKVKKKYNGEELSEEWALKVADRLGYAVIPTMAKRWYNCHFWPILKSTERLEDYIKIFKKYEDIIIEDPNTGLKMWTNTNKAALKGGVIGYMTNSFFFDTTDPEASKRALECQREILKLTVEKGASSYRMGRTSIGYSDHIWANCNPLYFETLKKIKQILDPNNIMNPGALSLI